MFLLNTSTHFLSHFWPPLRVVVASMDDSNLSSKLSVVWRLNDLPSHGVYLIQFLKGGEVEYTSRSRRETKRWVGHGLPIQLLWKSCAVPLQSLTGMIKRNADSKTLTRVRAEAKKGVTNPIDMVVASRRTTHLFFNFLELKETIKMLLMGRFN